MGIYKMGPLPNELFLYRGVGAGKKWFLLTHKHNTNYYKTIIGAIFYFYMFPKAALEKLLHRGAETLGFIILYKLHF